MYLNGVCMYLFVIFEYLWRTLTNNSSVKKQNKHNKTSVTQILWMLKLKNVNLWKLKLIRIITKLL